MKNSMNRSLKCRQIGLVQTYHLIQGTSATPVDSGLDSKFVQSITDNGTGDYTITFKEKAKLDLHVLGIAAITPEVTINVAAVDNVSVTITCLDSAGAAIDADFYLSVIHSVQLNYTF